MNALFTLLFGLCALCSNAQQVDKTGKQKATTADSVAAVNKSASPIAMSELDYYKRMYELAKDSASGSRTDTQWSFTFTAATLLAVVAFILVVQLVNTRAELAKLAADTRKQNEDLKKEMQGQVDGVKPAVDTELEKFKKDLQEQMTAVQTNVLGTLSKGFEENKKEVERNNKLNLETLNTRIESLSKEIRDQITTAVQLLGNRNQAPKQNYKAEQQTKFVSQQALEQIFADSRNIEMRMAEVVRLIKAGLPTDSALVELIESMKDKTLSNGPYKSILEKQRDIEPALAANENLRSQYYEASQSMKRVFIHTDMNGKTEIFG